MRAYAFVVYEAIKDRPKEVRYAQHVNFIVGLIVVEWNAVSDNQFTQS